MAGGLGVIAALLSAGAAGSVLAQGSAETLRGVSLRASPTTGSGKTIFAEVIERALADPAYAAQLKTLAAETRQGNKTAATQLEGVFHMSPTDLKAVNAAVTINPNVLMSTSLCVTIGVTLTLLFSCITAACKEAE
jgi:hypothetical protein